MHYDRELSAYVVPGTRVIVSRIRQVCSASYIDCQRDAARMAFAAERRAAGHGGRRRC